MERDLQRMWWFCFSGGRIRWVMQVLAQGYRRRQKTRSLCTPHSWFLWRIIKPRSRREAGVFSRENLHVNTCAWTRGIYILFFQIPMLLKNAQKYTWAITFLAVYIFVIRFRELPWKISLLKLGCLALKVSSYPSKSTVLIRCEGELTKNVPTLLCSSRKKCRRFTSNLVQISLKDLTFPEQPKTKTAREDRPLSQKRQQTAFETSIMEEKARPSKAKLTASCKNLWKTYLKQ